ncbi:MATE family efflux transporter [Haliscomenobacter hydrossis]|uniref:Polysaccharide biosynthesis protein n=1 Tax=Haliscomenobacter hydrossis (strain ATCC 27775 / DSM 1100 / LMG 10767 / O) TaxID=760192 RepID=F4KR22_HALH1|nr:MATE family efflux transporter [Haliscomenobacter hydrossis]AEE53260.1 polysaccharide biosynthesis protein [Haliscomenobacter hydrossis DSM 1100]
MNKLQSKTAALVFNLLNKGHERSIKIKKNILESILIKGGSVLVSLVMVPLTIDYINPSRYGIWLTISSVVAWVSFFDIGLTQGLRNKFAQAKAAGDDDRAQVYVSTAYALLGLIFCVVWLLFLVVSPFLNWSTILGITANMRAEVSTLAVIVFTYFCIQFVLKIITTILIADQSPSKAALIDFLGQVLSLVFIVVLIRMADSSLILLGIALCLSPLVILLGANFFLFAGKYQKYRPKISKVNFSYSKDLLNLGLFFFVIQIAFIIQYQTANFIIAQNFNTEDVVSYNIVFKYFGVLEMVSIIFVAPFWSASTEAFMKGDIPWIKSSIKHYNTLNILLALTSIIMLLLSSKVYELWLGKGIVDINFQLSLWGFLFFNVSIFSGKYVEFLNGISALRLQFFASLISPFVYIISALVLIKYFHVGVHAVFIAAIVANFNGFILAPLQYFQIIERNKRGIWAK